MRLVNNPWKVSTLVLAGALAFVVGGRSFAISDASADPQPRMKAALAALQSAKGQLEKASADKGGHRVVRALDLTNQALDEVKKGVEDSKR